MSTDTAVSRADKPLVIFARLLAKAGKEEAMKAALLKMIEPTRARRVVCSMTFTSLTSRREYSSSTSRGPAETR